MVNACTTRERTGEEQRGGPDPREGDNSPSFDSTRHTKEKLEDVGQDLGTISFPPALPLSQAGRYSTGLPLYRRLCDKGV